MALPQETLVPARERSVQLARGLDELLDDCRCLARYAVETDQLPASVNVKRLYKIRQAFEAGEEVSDEDFGALVSIYETLERRLGPVNVNTLRATEDTLDDAGNVVSSRARRYVDYLFARTALIIALVLAGHLVHFFFPFAASGPAGGSPAFPDFVSLSAGTTAGLVATFMIPFLYGALGADAFLLRETTHKLHTRQFDPRRIPENRARFLLGTLSGGVIVLFVSSDLLDTPDTVFNVGGAALGFVAGFSTDFLFGTIERVVAAVLPRGEVRSAEGQDRRAEDELLQRYRRLMDEAQNEEKKQILKGVVEDLEARARYRS